MEGGRRQEVQREAGTGQVGVRMSRCQMPGWETDRWARCQGDGAGPGGCLKGCHKNPGKRLQGLEMEGHAGQTGTLCWAWGSNTRVMTH